MHNYPPDSKRLVTSYPQSNGYQQHSYYNVPGQLPSDSMHHQFSQMHLTEPIPSMPEKHDFLSYNKEHQKYINQQQVPRYQNFPLQRQLSPTITPLLSQSNFQDQSDCLSHFQDQSNSISTNADLQEAKPRIPSQISISDGRFFDNNIDNPHFMQQPHIPPVPANNMPNNYLNQQTQFHIPPPFVADSISGHHQLQQPHNPTYPGHDPNHYPDQPPQMDAHCSINNVLQPPTFSLPNQVGQTPFTYQQSSMHQNRKQYEPTNPGYMPMNKPQSFPNYVQSSSSSQIPQILPPGSVQQKQRGFSQSQHKISPEQLPNYIRGKNDLASKYGSVFETGTTGLPPSSTHNIVYKDTGNVSPRFVRSTLYSIPTNQEMIKQSQLPVSFLITPLAETNPSEDGVPLTAFEGVLPIRCNRCKAYMSPQMRFIDGGNKFKCVFCDTNTAVPPEYFAHIDYSGKRVDINMKPELFSSSYDIVATVEYCEKNVFPNPAKFIFVIDVSYNCVRCGLVQLIMEKLRSDVLEFLPKDSYNSSDTSPVEIAIITFDSKLHFYNFHNMDHPEMLIVSDVGDAFVPLLDGFFIGVDKFTENFDRYLQRIFEMYSNRQETNIALGPSIQAACSALQAAECPGKIFVFASCLPSDPNIPGHLANRDEQNLLGTEKEKTALSPASKYYTDLGKQCIGLGCAVDLFLFANQFIDVGSLSEVSKLSGGQVYYYRYFSVNSDGDRFLADLRYTVARTTAFNAVMRVRSSNGIRATDFIGSFHMNNVTDMEFGAIDCDKTVCVEFSYDDKIAENSMVYFQIALLFTSIGGRRIIRVHNIQLPSSSNMLDMYQNTHTEAIVAYILKVAARSTYVSNITQIRSNVINQLAMILSCYRNHSPNASSSSLLVLPESLTMIPLFVNSILKCDAIGGVQSVTPDLKCWLLNQTCSMGVSQIIVMLYPSMHAVDINSDQQNSSVPNVAFKEVRCMYEALNPVKIFILENGLSIWIWIGQCVPSNVVNFLFGVCNADDIKLNEIYELPQLNNVVSQAVRNFITNIMIERKRLMRVNVIKQGHTLEAFFRNHLVEDIGLGGSKSYADFLFELHGEIRNLASQ